MQIKNIYKLAIILYILFLHTIEENLEIAKLSIVPKHLLNNVSY